MRHIGLGVLTTGLVMFAVLQSFAETAAEGKSDQIVYETFAGQGKGDLNVTIVTAASYSSADGLVTVMPLAENSQTICAGQTVLSKDEARSLVIRVAQEQNFDDKLALAIIDTESKFKVDALSPKGAIGLMQLMPETAKRYSVDPCNAEQNVRGGIAYFKDLTGRFGNTVFALAAYNAGPERIDQYHGVPPFKETLDYVARNLTFYYGLQNEIAVHDSPENAVNINPTRKAVKPVTATKPARGGQPGPEWASGFVMNID
jgi:soluble lytic murein transglycosylase-like protein